MRWLTILFVVCIAPAFGMGTQVPTSAAVPNQGADTTAVTSFKVAIFKAKDGGLTFNKITGQRAMADYDDGGHFDCRRFTPSALKEPKRVDATIEAARVFILEHWRFKKRAYLRVTLDSVDATTTSHIFVEPDSAGRWELTWRAVRHYGQVDDFPPIRSIERKSIQGRSVLVFSGAAGETIESL